MHRLEEEHEQKVDDKAFQVHWETRPLHGKEIGIIAVTAHRDQLDQMKEIILMIAPPTDSEKIPITSGYQSYSACLFQPDAQIEKALQA